MQTYLQKPGSLPSTNEVLKTLQTWPKAFYMVAPATFSIITIIMGVGYNAKLGYCQFKWPKKQ